ncbi:OIT3 [Branchiostoma lanceolatum]|uniref:OIT3 protein n=1 Tax=Branchiostoma lanceolatum TaxID=7740 RepID=A0A8K0A6Y4_BRALA|nr:OIT3 [Branchiostoma lanceolatum]
MQLSLPKAALPGVSVDNLHLLDDTCRVTDSPTHVTAQTGLQECGTIQNTSAHDKLTFINEIIANQVTYENGAVRGTTFRKRFQCEFLRQYEVSQGKDILYNIPSPRVQIVNANNSFTFEMHMFTSADFTATYKSDNFPLQVLHSDRIHYGLSVQSPLGNMELFALHCVSTPTMDPDDSPKVTIIQDGCDIDPTLTRDSTRSTDMALYFSIQAFTFPDSVDSNLVYLHCTMVICLKDDLNSRCREGCISARRRRDVGGDGRARRDSSNDLQQTVTQGPVRVLRDQEADSNIPVVGVAVGAVVGLASLLLLVVAVILVRRKRAKAQAKDFIGESSKVAIW